MQTRKPSLGVALTSIATVWRRPWVDTYKNDIHTWPRT